MGYLFLGVALLMSKVKGYCGKKISGYTSELRKLLLISLIRLALCVPFGFAFAVLLTGRLSEFIVSPTTIIICSLSGFSSAIFVFTWLTCIRKGAYAMIDVFLTIGVVVPLILCSVFFKERIGHIRWLGVFLLVLATVIMCWYSKGIKQKQTGKSLLVLILCGLANGLNQFAQKWFTRQGESNASVFIFYAYIFATLTLLVLFFAFNFKKKHQKFFPSVTKRTFFYVLVMAVSLFLHSYFSTLSAEKLSSAELFPLQQGLGLILSVIMSAIFFKERINLKCVVGISVTLLALFIINVLPSIASR